jgi:hypothetical protein
MAPSVAVKAVRLFIAQWATCLAVWFIVLLPLSPSVWSVYVTEPYCFSRTRTEHGGNPVECLFDSAAEAPLALLLGPIAHDEDDPPSAVPKVLAIALLMATLATALSAVVQSLRTKRR